MSTHDHEPTIDARSVPTDVLIRFARGALADLVRAFDAMNGAANYTETRARCGDREYAVTVQRCDKPTPHQLRVQADAVVTKQAAEIDALRARVSEQDAIITQLRARVSEHA